MEEREIKESLEDFKARAVENAVNAFNEGFLLGVKHAEREFNK